MSDPIARNHSSRLDNQSHVEDYAGCSEASPPRPAASRKPLSQGAAQLVAQHQQKRSVEPAGRREAGLVSDAVKTVAPKLLGPLETPVEAAALCAKHPVQCAAVAKGALIAGAGYVLYEAVFGAEAGPLPPEPGGRCEVESKHRPPTDPCETESSVACLPLAYRDGSEE